MVRVDKDQLFFEDNGKRIYRIVQVKGIRKFLVDGPGGQRSTIIPMIKIGKKLI